MTGIVTLSMEIELAWGVHDKPTAPHLSTDGSVERAYLQRLLGCCDDHEVPITFDVVGHLLESACSGTHDGPHEEGWFENDPGTDADRDPLFYAPDIVPDIDARPTAHELCTHTYSHVLCGAASTETVAWELETAQRDLEALLGGRPRSFVPPRHSRPPTPVLQETGIEIMRMSVDTTGDGRLARLQELVIGPHPDFGPATMGDVVETYCTSYPSLTAPTLPSGQRQPAWPFSAVPVRVRQRLQKLYLGRVLDRTAANDGQCHLWCHLYDLSNQYQWPVIEWFLEELAARREQGTLQVMTMASLNDHVRSGVGAGGGRGSGGEASDRPVLE